MLSIRDTLLWYKRLDVRQAMLLGCKNKEIGIRYGEGFGKRPDALDYEQDILEAVQRGATSFHASEETWTNPRLIETGMSKKQLDEIRTGWDLVLDVDFTNFEATKLITQALCKELEKNGVKHYGVKFSGNKGFHIGIAWECFPEKHTAPMNTLFPDGARQIANYLVHCLDNPENNFRLSEELKTIFSDEEAKPFLKTVCSKCGRDKIDKKTMQYFVCRKCSHSDVRPGGDEPYLQCAVCGSFMERVMHEAELNNECICGGIQTREKFDLKIDTQLISSRHLYRLEYSMHEKSGLVSLPIPKENILTFTRDEAKPEHINKFPSFWERQVKGEAASLFMKAMQFRVPDSKDNTGMKEAIWDEAAAPEETFPPTIKKMLAGMEDGRKRSLFILTNFLRSVGWNYDMIEERLDKWNAANREQLREVELKGHLRYHKQRGTVILPPNFDNDIYKDLGMLEHDELSIRMKNPVQYVRLKMKQQSRSSDHNNKNKQTKKKGDGTATP